MQIENLSKKQIIKLVSIFALIIFLIIGIIFIIVTMTIEDNNYKEPVKVEQVKKNSIDRSEDEERQAVQDNINNYTNLSESNNIEIKPYSQDRVDELATLPTSSYDEYIKNIRLLSRSGSWSEISTLVVGIIGEYNFTPEQEAILYPLINITDLQNEDFEMVQRAWDAISDLEVKIYAFLNMPASYQASIISSLDIDYIPAVTNGVLITDIQTEGVGWEESKAWLYFSDEEATHINKITVELNGSSDNKYDIYYVENDLIGNYITNIVCKNPYTTPSSYREFLEMSGIESETILFDGYDW